MPKVIKLPQLGQTMEEGTIVKILLEENAEIKKGDVIFEIETDKASLEMEANTEGFVKKILVKEWETLPVGASLAVVGEKDEEVSPEYIAKLMPSSDAAANNGSMDVTTEFAYQTENLAAPAIENCKLGDSIPLSRMQKIIGQRMVSSKQNIPCFYLNNVVDVTALIEHRAKVNENSPVKVSYNDFIMKAVSDAILEFPLMAGQIDGDSIKVADHVSIGIAVAVNDGLVAPICRDTEKKTVVEIAQYNQDLITKAKNNSLKPDDISGGCITLSNLGAFGIDSFIPIVVPGQCSILGVGQISNRLEQDGKEIVDKKQMKITLSVDHKIANGAYAAQFLDTIRKRLESPESL